MYVCFTVDAYVYNRFMGRNSTSASLRWTGKSKQKTHPPSLPLSLVGSVQASSTNSPVMEGRGVPEQTSLPSWACWWTPWRWVCQAGRTARQRWTRRWGRGPARKPKSNRKPAGPAGSAALGPDAVKWKDKLLFKSLLVKAALLLI